MRPVVPTGNIKVRERTLNPIEAEWLKRSTDFNESLGAMQSVTQVIQRTLLYNGSRLMAYRLGFPLFLGATGFDW